MTCRIVNEEGTLTIVARCRREHGACPTEFHERGRFHVFTTTTEADRPDYVDASSVDDAIDMIVADEKENG